MGGRGLRRACAFALAAALTFGVGSASGRSTGDQQSCTWGASSITAEYVNGQLVQSQPVTTGCIP
jgi:hypothetical protein